MLCDRDLGVESNFSGLPKKSIELLSSIASIPFCFVIPDFLEAFFFKLPIVLRMPPDFSFFSSVLDCRDSSDWEFFRIPFLFSSTLDRLESSDSESVCLSESASFLSVLDFREESDSSDCDFFRIPGLFSSEVDRLGPSISAGALDIS